MDDALFERLLYEEESDTLDFKRDQYPFSGATDEEQSELLKDILGFANAWRRAEAYILIGVEDVRGGRKNVVGIPPGDHLDDHSLQQFVGNKTNRPLLFHYAAFGFEGKQVGIIRIEEQDRPVYLKKNFGKLRANAVYVRRGSSTDPTKPAAPDEIARMGARAAPAHAELNVAFAAFSRDESLGTRIAMDAEFCAMPATRMIPLLKEARDRNSFPGLDLPALPGTPHTNMHYYRKLAEYEMARRLFRPVRFVVTNTGPVAATRVHVQMTVPADGSVCVSDPSGLPDAPERVSSGFPYDAAIKHIRPAWQHSSGDVTIRKDDDAFRIEIDCGSLQPGRQVWSERFYVGIAASGEFSLRGRIFADNLPAPADFTLTIVADIRKTEMTVAELKALPEPAPARW